MAISAGTACVSPALAKVEATTGKGDRDGRGPTADRTFLGGVIHLDPVMAERCRNGGIVARVKIA
jgi:hypothetical protein